jgi:8-oxo-dGTP pyrophosphatase MutT (NUDIX family)
MAGDVDQVSRDPPPGERVARFRLCRGSAEVSNAGPRLKSDVVDVYVFRRVGRKVEFLQLHRTGRPLDGTWQPVMGHIRKGESAIACAKRELREEVGLSTRTPHLLGLWALELVHPFFLAEMNAIYLCPRFAAEVPRSWRPRLNGEHDAWRWVHGSKVKSQFMWPGQHGAIVEIMDCLIRPGSLAEPRLRIHPKSG